MPRNSLPRRSNAPRRAAPSVWAGTVPPLARSRAYYDGLVRGVLARKTRVQIAPAVRGCSACAARPSRPATLPAVSNSVNQGGAATRAAARLKVQDTQIFTRTSWKRMVKMSKPLTMATACSFMVLSRSGTDLGAAISRSRWLRRAFCRKSQVNSSKNGDKPCRGPPAAPADLAAAAGAQRDESNDAAMLINHFPS